MPSPGSACGAGSHAVTNRRRLARRPGSKSLRRIAQGAGQLELFAVANIYSRCGPVRSFAAGDADLLADGDRAHHSGREVTRHVAAELCGPGLGELPGERDRLACRHLDLVRLLAHLHPVGCISSSCSACQGSEPMTNSWSTLPV